MLKEKFIYESILFERAAKYRLSLIQQNFTEEEKKQYIISIARNSDIDLSSSSILNSIIDNNNARAQTYDRNLKNTMMYLYFYNEYKTSFNNLINNFKSNLKNYFTSLSKDLLNIEAKLESASYSSKNNKTKNVFRNSFKDRAGYELYRREDPKQTVGFSLRQSLSADDNLLKLREMNKIKVVPREIFLVEEESFNGDTTKPVYSNNVYNLREDNTPFRFLVLKKSSDKTGIKLKQEIKNVAYPYNKKVQMTVLFDFVGKKKINNIRIRTASSLPVNIEGVKYWNGSSWLNLNFFTKETNNIYNCFFESIRAFKVKVTFSQKKYLDVKNLKDNKTEIESLIDKSYLSFFSEEQRETEGYLHDLSVDTVEFFFSIYRKKGIYVDNDKINVSKPVSFQFDLNYLLDNSLVYAEKYLNIVLYGEESILAFKKAKQLEEDARLKSPRLNKIVAIPSGEGKEKELLVFNRNQAKLNFFPKKDSLVIKLNGVILDSTEYQVSINGGETFIAGNDLIQANINEAVAGNLIVKINNISAINEYSAEYFLEKNQRIKDTELFIKNRKVVLPKSLRDSYGFIRPIIILRSKDNISDNTDIIKSFRVIVGEKESVELGYIEYERFLERVSRGTNNVIE